VHEASQLLTPRRAKDEAALLPGVEARGKRKRAALTPAEEFEAYVEAPEPMTTLVLVTEPLDRSRRITKLLHAKAALVDCGSLESAADAARWIRARLDRDELSIEPAAVAALLDGTGLRLARIRAEVEKLVLYAAGEAAVTVRHVKDLVLPQAEPGEDFALGKAIWNGDAAGALREIAAQFEGGAQAPMVLGQIRAAAGRLRPDARAKRGLEQVFDADLAVKSSGGEPRYLLERLVVELCAGGGGGGWGRR
jgi:DNA polymerase III delta subunit